MTSKKVPKEFKTSRMTTIKLINELEESGRIEVLRGEGDEWRQGQPHYLMVNDKSWFDYISGQITNIGDFLREHPETQERMLNLLLINLARVLKYIDNENDKQWLNQEIINALLKIRYKTDKDLASKV